MMGSSPWRSSNVAIGPAFWAGPNSPSVAASWRRISCLSRRAAAAGPAPPGCSLHRASAPSIRTAAVRTSFLLLSARITRIPKDRSRRARRGSRERAFACGGCGGFRQPPEHAARHPDSSLCTRSRCAVSRHQPFGWASSSTSSRRRCAEAAASVPRVVVSCTTRQIRPRPIGCSSPRRDDLVAQVFRDVAAVLNDAAVHVHDVQRAVGRRRQIHRPEALVGRREELARSYAFARAQRRAVVADDDAADQFAGRLGDEDVAVQIRRQPIAAIDRWARRPPCNVASVPSARSMPA